MIIPLPFGYSSGRMPLILGLRIWLAKQLVGRHIGFVMNVCNSEGGGI